MAALAFFGAAMAGNVDGPLRMGHWVMFAVISLSSLGAMLRAVFGPWQPRPVVGYVVVATLFFALGNAILVIPLGLVPSWLALASTGFDVALLGVAVAMWDAFDEGQALRGDMLRSSSATAVVAVLFGGQALIGMAMTGQQTALTVLLFTSLAHRDFDQRAGRSACRHSRPAGVLPLAGDCAPTARRCAVPRLRCRCGRQAARPSSMTRPSRGSPVARSATTATCPSSSPAR